MGKSIQSKKIGVLGGGQLGRMLIQSALDFNLDLHIIDPDENAPCKAIGTSFTVGSLTDYDTIYQFGKTCDLLTIEIENVNTEALKQLQKEGVVVYPQPEIIELIKDKRTQKQFYKDKGIPTADFVLTDSSDDVAQKYTTLPVVNKLGREGYDGRGVQILHSESDLSKAFDAPGLLEELVDFKKEIAIIVARNASGEMETFPAVEMVFHPEANLVEYLFAPAQLPEAVVAEANRIARKVIHELDMVGILAVEMFVTHDDKVLVNEVAPRPHNSGHQTIEANHTSQYEQHLRAILDLPLGNCDIILPSAMVNVLGEEGHTGEAIYQGLNEVISKKGVHVHLYGKKLTKPFRKMGHVTLVHEDMNMLKSTAQFVKSTLKVITES